MRRRRRCGYNELLELAWPRSGYKVRNLVYRIVYFLESYSRFGVLSRLGGGYSRGPSQLFPKLSVLTPPGSNLERPHVRLLPVNAKFTLLPLFHFVSVRCVRSCTVVSSTSNRVGGASNIFPRSPLPIIIFSVQDKWLFFFLIASLLSVKTSTLFDVTHCINTVL